MIFTLHELARTVYRMVSDSNRSSFCLFLLFAGVIARGELVLTNFNASILMKIMAIGIRSRTIAPSMALGARRCSR
jgi:hypothetical protein